MSRTILRDAEAVRPWPPAPLRSATPEDTSAFRAAGHEPEEAVDPTTGEAEALLQQARLEAAELMRAAQEEAERLRASACERGREEAREEWQQELARLQGLASELGSAYDRFCRNQLPALAELAMLAAEKLWGERLALEPERVLAIVRTAMEEVLGSTQVTLRLHPEDVELVRSESLASSTGPAPATQIVPDPAVERGGCWLDSDQGKVDATVAGRLARIAAALQHD